MEQPPVPHRRHWVGMRIINSSLAVFLCGLLAFLRGQSAFYSMIAAVVCLQSSTGQTIRSSINRAAGTLVGGAAGVLAVYLMDLLGVLRLELVRYLVVALTLIPLIRLTLLIKMPAISAFTCVVFLCVTVTSNAETAPALYALERMFETLVGVAAACAVDLLLPYRPQAEGQSAQDPPHDPPPENERKAAP